MNVKKILKNQIRGWIPKEASLPSTVTAQVNQKTSPHNLIIVYVTIFAAVFATVFLTLGILEVLSLGSYSSFAAGAAAAVAAAFASVLIIRSNQSPNINKGKAKQ
ncbi:MAG: hypothetical protein ACQCN4_10015 [Candidatus Bathyarchaeia archaeon]|jgi:hypothetical protein